MDKQKYDSGLSINCTTIIIYLLPFLEKFMSLHGSTLFGLARNGQISTTVRLSDIKF